MWQDLPNLPNICGAEHVPVLMRDEFEREAAGAWAQAATTMASSFSETHNRIREALWLARCFRDDGDIDALELDPVKLKHNRR